jgi:hypothetical protein
VHRHGQRFAFVQITNSGPNNARSHNVTILWPYETLEDDWENGKLLLYLVDEPVLEVSSTLSSVGTKIDGHCERASHWRDHLRVLDSLDRTSTFNRKRREEQNAENAIESKTSSTATTTTPIQSTSSIRSLTLTCDPAYQNVRCYPIHCHIRSLAAQSYYFIKLHARLWNSTLIENYFDTYDRVDIQSFAHLQINDSLLFQTSTMNDQATVSCLEHDRHAFACSVNDSRQPHRLNSPIGPIKFLFLDCRCGCRWSVPWPASYFLFSSLLFVVWYVPCVHLCVL